MCLGLFGVSPRLGLAAGAAAPETVAAWATQTDLDGDGRAEQLAFYRDASGRRGFLTVTGARGRWTSGVYPAWKATTGDLDGDGRAEVLLGIWTQRRRPGRANAGPHRTVWVLAWERGALVERWRGSSLARPLVDFAVHDLDGDGRAELLALEREGAGRRLTAYRSTGFGLVGAGRSAPLEADAAFDPNCPSPCVAQAARRSAVRIAPGSPTGRLLFDPLGPRTAAPPRGDPP